MQVKSTEAVSTDYIHLNSCGCQHLFGENTHTVRPYGRRDYHILYITEGRCIVTIGGKDISVDAGSVIFFFPGERHEYRFMEDIRTTSLYLHFSGESPKSLLGSIERSARRVFFVGKSETLEALFRKTEQEYMLALPFAQETARGYLLAILSLILRKISFFETEAQTASVEKITHVCRYMQTVLADNLPISEFARICNLSESRFTHLFHEIIGMSPIAYLTEIRMNKAKELLSYSALPVSEVGEAVGITNPYYFSRAFKKHTGYSPTEYRRAGNGGEN